MKRFYHLLAALALVVSMQGCESGPSVEPEIPNNPDNPTQSAVQLRLTGNIAAITPATRVNGSGFETNDKVGVYVSATGSLTSSGNMLNNEAFTYSSGNITAPEGKEVYWGSPDAKLSVWAYYPYVESVENNAAYPFEVNADQSTAGNYYNSDFITAQAANLAPQTEAVNLTFNHSLSKISVTLEAGEGITAEELALAEKSFYISDLATSGTIDLATGTATASEKKAQITPLASNDVNYEAIVYPQQGEVTFRLEMDGDVFIYSTQIDYAAAKQYDYTLTIDVREPQQMSLKTTTITPWGDGGETENGTMSDIISFNDPVFKAYLLSANLYELQENATESDITYEHVDTGKKIDANSDGEISIAEAEAVTYINVSQLGVTDLSGIEYFVNLEYLNCSQVQPAYSYDPETHEQIIEYPSKYLTSIDLSNNKKLKYLLCYYNCNLNDGKGLAALDLSENVDLKYLDCGGNIINELDLSKNVNLEYLYCSINNINELDVSKNVKLEYLDFNSNNLTTIDLSKNTKLKEVDCGDNQLTSLNLSQLQDLTLLSCSWNPMLSSLDVTKNLKLQTLLCWDMNLTTLDLTKNIELEVVQCNGNKLTALDVTKNTKLKNLWCGEQDITSIDVSKNVALTELECSLAKIRSLDLSKNLDLVELRCDFNELTELNLSANEKLTYLSCCFNYLTTLDVSMISNLDYLYCNPMEDAEGNNLLETIYIADGQEIGTLEKPEETVIEEI